MATTSKKTTSKGETPLQTMNRLRQAQGLAPQTAVGVKAPKRESTIINDKNQVVGKSSGKVYGTGKDTQDALALQNQVTAGSTPTLSGRPDLLARTPLATETVESFTDPTLRTTVTPRVATDEERAAQQAGTLTNYPKSQGLVYLDGPTFSKLQPNMTEDDLVRAGNGQIYLRQGLTPEQVMARNQTTPTTTTTAPPVEDLDVELPPEIDSDIVDEAMTDPKTEEDIAGLVAEQERLQKEYLAEMAPSQELLDLKQQLADLHAEVRAYQDSLNAGLNEIEDQTIPMSFITGQQASLERRAQAQQQVYASQEANLLDAIGLEQEAEQMRLMSKEMAIKFFQDNVALSFEIQDRIDAKAEKVYQRARELSQDAQSKLYTMMEMFQGMDRSDMSDEAWLELQKIAIAAGIPIELVEEGLSAMKAEKTATESGILSSEALAAYNTINDNMAQDSAIKDFSIIRDSYNRIVSGAAQDSGVGDMAIVYGYMKMLDPTSVVREGEYATAENAGGVAEYIRNAYNKVVSGERLSSDLRDQFVTGAEAIYTPKREDYRRAFSYYENLAIAAGLDPSLVLRNIDTDGDTADLSGRIDVNRSFMSVEALLEEYPELESTVDAWRSELGMSDKDILLYIEKNGGVDFNSVGADTNTGAGSKLLSKATSYSSGDKGGQCGRFVNQIAGTKMGDTYKSKMAYVNVPVTQMPQPGDIFVMPYESYGHTGFVVGARKRSDGTYDVDVVDSNWGLDERVRYHTINSKNLSGYARLS